MAAEKGKTRYFEIYELSPPLSLPLFSLLNSLNLTSLSPPHPTFSLCIWHVPLREWYALPVCTHAHTHTLSLIGFTRTHAHTHNCPLYSLLKHAHAHFLFSISFSPLFHLPLLFYAPYFTLYPLFLIHSHLVRRRRQQAQKENLPPLDFLLYLIFLLQLFVNKWFWIQHFLWITFLLSLFLGS